MRLEKIRPSAFLVQFISTICIAYLISMAGFIYAWPSYTLENFISNDTVLSHPMSATEISLLGSLTNVGGMIATPFSCYAVDSFGRKYAAMLFGLPYVFAWAIISVTNYVPLVLFAIGLSGIGAAGQTVSTIFISEISQDSIRGALTSTTVSQYYIGLLISYILGGYLSYSQVVYGHLTLAILYVVMISLLKESPVFLLQKGREEEAKDSLAFYRHLDVTSKEVELEINVLRRQLDPNIDKLHRESDDASTQKLITTTSSKEIETKTESSWRILLNSESSKRALFSVLVLMAASIMMGAIVIQVYAAPLFKEAVPSMSSSDCAIFLAVVFLVASFVCTFLIDKFGRKALMTYTSIAAGVCSLLLGSQLQFHWAPHYCTALLIYSYCFVYNLGAATVPFVLAAEVFLPEVRSLCNNIVMASVWIINFFTLMIFSPIMELLGFGPVFYIFAIICFFGGSFSFFFLPETKGLSADAIQTLFVKKRVDSKV